MAALPGLIIPTEAAALIVPAASVAEIILSPPEVKPLPASPPWVLGYIHWRNYPVTLVSFERLASDQEISGFSRICVLYPLPGREAYDYFAVVTNGEPRSLEITDAVASAPLPPRVSKRYAAGAITLDHQTLVIPGLEALKTAFYPYSQ